MIIIGNCQCETKWQVIKAHIRGIFEDFRKLNQVCEVADRIIAPTKGFDPYNFDPKLHREYVEKIADDRRKAADAARKVLENKS